MTGLDRLLAPRSIALIGASPERGKIRGALLHILRANGFAGALYPVNPSYREIDGLVCYPAVAAIGQPVDLALIAVPAPGVPAVLEECAAAGVSFAAIISSGFAEEGGARVALQEQMQQIARRTGLRLLGPNAEGFHNEHANVSATFSPVVERLPDAFTVKDCRRIGVVAQSGGMGFALYNRGRALGLAFSSVISTGNEADLSAADFFRHLVEDPETGVVLLFLESIRDPAGFVAAASRSIELGKPVVVAKIGASQAGERATASHTASMAGWDAAYQAVFQRFGLLTARDPDEAVALAGALATSPLAPGKRAAGKRAAIVTVSGGAGAWCADLLAAAGLDLPELSPALQRSIALELPSYGSARNPVDVTAQAVHNGALARSITKLGRSDEIDLIVLVLGLASATRIALGTEVLAGLRAGTDKPILIFSYTIPSAAARRVMAEAGAVIQSGLSEIAAAARALTEERPMRGALPAARRSDLPLPANRTGVLAEHESKRLLAAAGLSIPPEILVGDDMALAQATAEIGFPLALKLQSRDLPHKTESGGVALHLPDLESARLAYRAMLAQAATLDPRPRIDGVLVQKMARPGLELIIGAVRDPGFGPIVTIGAGGIATELHRDIRHVLAPLDRNMALAALRELAIWPLLAGFRGRAPADIDALAALITAIGDIACAHADRIAEIELNPVIVHEAGTGCTIIDALITLG
jgi:acetate---CoA ligase (ADP-forming)